MGLAGIVAVVLIGSTIAIEIACLSFLVSFSRRDGKKDE